MDVKLVRLLISAIVMTFHFFRPPENLRNARFPYAFLMVDFSRFPSSPTLFCLGLPHINVPSERSVKLRDGYSDLDFIIITTFSAWKRQM